jgi:hypothetical protein
MIDMPIASGRTRELAETPLAMVMIDSAHIPSDINTTLIFKDSTYLPTVYAWFTSWCGHKLSRVLGN